MLLGVDICGMNQGAIFDTTNFLGSYYSLQLENALIDDVYVSQDTTISSTPTKPTTWQSLDVLNADFNLSLEGGSISGNGQNITSVVLQNRNTNGLTWNTVATIPYVSGSSILFQYTDNYVQNGAQYQYQLIPYINSVQGIIAPNSVYITASYDSTFITDKNNNYILMYDLKPGSIIYNQNSKIFEPLDSTYPIVQYGSLDYRSVDNISATLLSADTLNSSTGIVINSEVTLRQNLVAFLTNKQAKLLRSRQGDFMLVTLVNKPTISFATSQPIASVSFSMVEVGGTDSATLMKFGL